MSPPKIRTIRPVKKRTTKDEILCLDVYEGSKNLGTLVCLGRVQNVSLPLNDWVRRKIEERFEGEIDWGEVYRGISSLVAH